MLADNGDEGTVVVSVEVGARAGVPCDAVCGGERDLDGEFVHGQIPRTD
jgi:hypothetical protein